MNNLKRIIIFVLIMGLVFIAPLQASAKDMFLASAFESDHILLQMGRRFKELVNEYTNGEIQVDISAGGAMGGEKELFEQTSTGSVDGTIGGTHAISLWAPDYYWFGSPFVLKKYEASKAMWESDIGAQMRQKLIDNGNVRMLNLTYRGTRNTTSNEPFYTPQELVDANIKLRLPIIPDWVTVWEEIGAKIATVDLSELFTAVQMGVADATEGASPQILTVHLDEVQEYLIMTSHLVSTGGVTVNEDYFQSLTEDQQKAVKKAARESAAWASRKQLAEENKQIVELQKKGMKIIIPDKKAFIEAAKPALKKLFNTKWAGEYEDVEQFINMF